MLNDEHTYPLAYACDDMKRGINGSLAQLDSDLRHPSADQLRLVRDSAAGISQTALRIVDAIDSGEIR